MRTQYFLAPVVLYICLFFMLTSISVIDDDVVATFKSG